MKAKPNGNAKWAQPWFWTVSIKKKKKFAQNLKRWLQNTSLHPWLQQFRSKLVKTQAGSPNSTNVPRILKGSGSSIRANLVGKPPKGLIRDKSQEVMFYGHLLADWAPVFSSTGTHWHTGQVFVLHILALSTVSFVEQGPENELLANHINIIMKTTLLFLSLALNLMQNLSMLVITHCLSLPVHQRILGRHHFPSVLNAVS